MSEAGRRRARSADRERSADAASDWRAYRPAIWMVMIGIAVIIVVSPHFLGAFFLGGAIGAALRIRQRRRRARAVPAKGRSR